MNETQTTTPTQDNVSDSLILQYRLTLHPVFIYISTQCLECPL